MSVFIVSGVLARQSIRLSVHVLYLARRQLMLERGVIVARRNYGCSLRCILTNKVKTVPRY